MRVNQWIGVLQPSVTLTSIETSQEKKVVLYNLKRPCLWDLIGIKIKIISIHFNACFLFERFTYFCHNYRLVRQELIPHMTMIDLAAKKHTIFN